MPIAPHLSGYVRFVGKVHLVTLGDRAAAEPGPHDGPDARNKAFRRCSAWRVKVRVP